MSVRHSNLTIEAMDSTSVADFIKAKAVNFLAFLEANNPDDDMKGYMRRYQPDTAVATIIALLLPMAAAGQLPDVADGIVKQLTPEDPIATREKVGRYLDCFVEAAKELA